ncbi:hypothetical protein BGX31_004414 [Mortierella sp. GBA43]|nr:hypothetical protein BGX31_004414 [Mortierella sp. GBA43]
MSCKPYLARGDRHSKMKINAPSTELEKIEDEKDEDIEAASVSEIVKISKLVGPPKEPIAPFRSFLHPNERQHKSLEQHPL